MRNRNFGMFLMLGILFLAINVYLNCKILEEYQGEIKSLKLQVDDLEREIKQFLDKWNIEVFEVTAYSPYDNRSGICNDGNPNYTATGTRPAPGTIAVNPKIIPYGTRLWVQGYGWGQALDTGGMIRVREDLIDVFHWTYEEAMKWGRRKAVVVWQN